MKKLMFGLFALLLVIMAAGGGVLPQVASASGDGADGVQVSIDAPAEVLRGSSFTATVNISQVIDLNGAQYEIVFDPSVLTVDNVTAGEIGSTEMPVLGFTKISSGRYRILQFLQDDKVSGSGYLAVLHFNVSGSMGDNSTINLSDGILSGWEAEIPATWIGDSVYVYGEDTTPPTVIATSPEANVTGVAIDTAIQVTFSESMNTTSVESAFSILPSAGDVYNWTDNVMTFVPDGNLAYNMAYTVTISTAAQDLAGNPLAEAYIWSFTTVPPPELVSIEVTPVAPSIALGLTQQFTAMGTYTDASTANITDDAIWASSKHSVATIQTTGQANPGLATSVWAGTTVITASLDGITSPGVTLGVIIATTVEVNNGKTITLGVGESVSASDVSGIPVEVKGLPDLGAPANGLAGFTFDFSWDKDVIHVDSAYEADAAGWLMILPGTPDNETGTLTSTGMTATYSTADVILLYLGIHAVGSAGGSTSINVTITSLGDKDGTPIPAIPVNAPVVIVNLIAETSISQALDQATSKIVVVKVNIDRIKDPATGETANITGGIGSYTATVSSTPGSGIEVLAVHGVSPFDNLTFDNVTGVFSVDNITSTSPIQADNTTVAEIVLRLSGNSTATYDLSVVFNIIGAAEDPGLHVLEEHSNTITFLRGNANDNDTVVDIFDALFIAQYIVKQRPLDEINALNGASVRQDGEDGDIIDIFDALFIAQKIVGQKDDYFE